MDEESIKDALRKINNGEKSLEAYVNILKNKLKNGTNRIEEIQDQIQYAQHNLEEAKVTLESDKLLLEGLEAIMSLSKNY